jgi:ABC-type multidrug transport system ATPase subunit
VATDPILAAEGIGKRYQRRVALRGVSLEVGRGETLALLGPNGAGKTTLLSILSGAVLPSEGTVRRPPDAETGWVPQKAALYSRLSPRENLRLFAGLEGVADPNEAAEQLLEQVDLARVADEPASTLSVGNQQRLNVAIGLLGDPHLVFLDEPTASLDPRQRLVLWRLLQAVAARDGAVVFATQNVDEARLYANRMAVLLDGGLVFHGTPHDFFAEAGVDEHDSFEHAFVAFLEHAATTLVPQQ